MEDGADDDNPSNLATETAASPLIAICFSIAFGKRAPETDTGSRAQKIAAATAPVTSGAGGCAVFTAL
jgi:hypothetical protein